MIDEAAAIPLPTIRNLLGSYVVFMASTINGYEGTGRSLSLKLLQELRNTSKSSNTSRKLKEVRLDTPIRYSADDPIEKWLNNLLCLDFDTMNSNISGCPHPESCDLYYVNRDTLFSYHAASELFLKKLTSLFVASHYKNSPNDLQLMSDAPAHHVFVLLAPVSADSNSLPNIICAIQVCLEGEVSREVVMKNLSRGKQASGDLIPWTLTNQFQDENFPTLSGARIVRIATHPDFQKVINSNLRWDMVQERFRSCKSLFKASFLILTLKIPLKCKISYSQSVKNTIFFQGTISNHEKTCLLF